MGFQVSSGFRSRCEDLYLLFFCLPQRLRPQRFTTSVPHGSVTFRVAASDLEWYEHSNIFFLGHWYTIVKSICHEVFFFTTKTHLLCCRLYKATNVNWHHCVPKSGLEKLGLAVKGRLIGVIQNIHSTCQKKLWGGKHILECMHWTCPFFLCNRPRTWSVCYPLAIAGVLSFSWHVGSWWIVLQHVGWCWVWLDHVVWD